MLYFVPGMRSLTRALEEWVWCCQSRFLFWRFKVDEKRMKTEIKTFLKRIVPRKLRRERVGDDDPFRGLMGSRQPAIIC